MVAEKNTKDEQSIRMFHFCSQVLVIQTFIESLNYRISWQVVARSNNLIIVYVGERQRIRISLLTMKAANSSFFNVFLFPPINCWNATTFKGSYRNRSTLDILYTHYNGSLWVWLETMEKGITLAIERKTTLGPNCCFTEFFDMHTVFWLLSMLLTLLCKIIVVYVVHWSSSVQRTARERRQDGLTW